MTKYAMLAINDDGKLCQYMEAIQTERSLDGNVLTGYLLVIKKDSNPEKTGTVVRDRILLYAY